MRDQIEKALQALKDHFTQSIFTNPQRFKAALADMPIESDARIIRNLLNIAISDIKAYSRLESGLASNNTFVVDNLVSEMSTDYVININAARTVIECIAGLLGYKPPLKDASVSAQDQTQPPPEIMVESNNGIRITPKIGGDISFGNYQWQVLDVDGSKALLITKDIIQTRPYEEHTYNVQLADVTWEKCSLRKYLNGEFLQSFTANQQSLIIEAKTGNPNNLWYGSPGGKDTGDKIFLLSLEEVDRYFGNSGDYQNKRRKGNNSGLFITESSGLFLSNIHDNIRAANFNGKAHWWWLRSPGYFSNYAAGVGEGGCVLVFGDTASNTDGGIRPALWLRL